jgi:hypothetical protein
MHVAAMAGEVNLRIPCQKRIDFTMKGHCRQNTQIV